MENACEPGNTLLWDLLQDENIEQLAEGLAAEAEQNLTNLLCFNMERFIRVKFMEGCLSNLSANRSVAVSLRLLPKLIQSFQNFRGGMDTHDVCMLTERRHFMTKLFFDNLALYTKQRREGNCPPPPFFNHLAQVQTRLQFLTMIFSTHVSPVEFRY